MWPFTGSSSSSGPSATTSTDVPPAPHPLPPGVTSADRCPVDEDTRQAWLDKQHGGGSGAGAENAAPRSGLLSVTGAYTVRQDGESSKAAAARAAAAAAAAVAAAEAKRAAALSKAREVSSIPRASTGAYNGGETDASTSAPAPAATGGQKEGGGSGGGNGNWVYPSPAQFYSAMARKNHNPTADDMPIVVSIHNAVNERAWQEIIAWEKGWAGRMPAPSGAAAQSVWREPAEECGGLKLVSFTGKPRELTWRAWGRTLLGFTAPFDRHDWIVDRCGTQMRYIIDFYTGRPNVAARSSPDGRPAQNLAFYLDVRPAPDTVEGWAMRFHRTWLRISGRAPLPGAAA